MRAAGEPLPPVEETLDWKERRPRPIEFSDDGLLTMPTGTDSDSDERGPTAMIWFRARDKTIVVDTDHWFFKNLLASLLTGGIDGTSYTPEEARWGARAAIAQRIAICDESSLTDEIGVSAVDAHIANPSYSELAHLAARTFLERQGVLDPFLFLDEAMESMEETLSKPRPVRMH